MTMQPVRSALAAGAAMAASLALTGCFLIPGQFEATMDVRKSGTFSFTYDGEIVITAMGDLAEMANAAEMAEDCIDEATLESRPCSEKELRDRAAEQEQQRAMMKAMMGSADLSDPDAATAFAENLERQTGWNSVEHLGDGVFDVHFGISSRLTHDFTFPVLEGFPVSTAFVTASLRDENRLRIEGAGFASQAGNPMQAMMMGGMAAAGAQQSSAKGGPQARPDAPQMQGTFRVVTDAAILTNNTEEGPRDAPGGQLLEWAITPISAVAPSALLRLDP